jgi:CRISPR-associated endonuclease Csy4
MKHYIDITLLPSDDIGHHFLWEKVYQQVHLAFVENKSTDCVFHFGITFPEFNAEKNRLGCKLRIFAASETLFNQLSINSWLNRLTDYVHITSIRSTPVHSKYVQFRRLQVKSSKERIARRKARRDDIPLDEAKAALIGFEEKSTLAPFINVKSLSKDKRFKLFVLQDISNFGGELELSSYGLSKSGFLPKF